MPGGKGALPSEAGAQNSYRHVAAISPLLARNLSLKLPRLGDGARDCKALLICVKHEGEA